MALFVSELSRGLHQNDAQTLSEDSSRRRCSREKMAAAAGALAEVDGPAVLHGGLLEEDTGKGPATVPLLSNLLLAIGEMATIAALMALAFGNDRRSRGGS